MLTVQPPQLNYNNDGIPCSSQFDDPYFSLMNPVDESRHVFIQGNQLTERWKRENFASHNFIIAELGFGFGVNFIITCEHWLKQSIGDADDYRQLHFISFEKYPIKKQELCLCHKELGLPSEISNHLIEQYPSLVSGYHRIHFKQYNVSLTLIFGDAYAYIKKSNFLANAWYLDGFSPNKNPELWTEEIAKQVYRLTDSYGSFATYSAASIVRKNFTKAGFSINKIQGYGRKREMLVGINTRTSKNEYLPHRYKNWLNTKSHKYIDKTAIVIGAGMAGCCTSAALAKRGWQVTLIDKHMSLANEGSGNPSAILMPRLSVDHDLQSQLTLQGYLYSICYLNQLTQHGSFTWQQCGAIQLPRDDAQWLRMQAITQKYSISEQLIQQVTHTQASTLCDCELVRDGWHIPQAGYVSPTLMCETLIDEYHASITLNKNTTIEYLEQSNEQWKVHSLSGNTYTADVVVLANARSINQFSQTHWCSLNSKRGQITYIPKHASNIAPKKIICADAYITPAVNSQLITGATFITNDNNTDLRQHEHEENIIKLSKMIPSFNLTIKSKLNGRAAIRAVSNDRLPIVGPACNKEIFFHEHRDAALGSTKRKYPTSSTYKGLYIASGFGTRGLAWIPLCTEALACMINNEPAPMDNTIMQAIHPNRFLMKELICKTKV